VLGAASAEAHQMGAVPVARCGSWTGRSLVPPIVDLRRFVSQPADPRLAASAAGGTGLPAARAVHPL